MIRFKGFTIIELMIVVAIIGVLAVIALPLFGNYSAKAQAAEGEYLLAGLKSPLVEAVSTTGIDACDEGKPWFTNSVHQGQYVDNVAITKNTGQCLLTITFKGSGINDKLVGKKMNIRYTVDGGLWECGSDLDTDIRSSSCSGNLLSL